MFKNLIKKLSQLINYNLISYLVIYADLRKTLLTKLTHNFISKTKYKLLVGVEIEFYLLNLNPNNLDNFIQDFKDQCTIKHINLLKFEHEKGINQYEISLAPGQFIDKLTTDLTLSLKLLKMLANKYECILNIDAKPLINQPGNALHINISLLDQNNNNVFTNINNKILLYCIGGMCALMQESMICFAPYQTSYNRFIAKTNAPTTVSWGGNNRTVAIRVPSTSNIRIEHRIACANSDIYNVLLMIIIAIDYGITNKIIPKQRIYGDAADSQYNLPKLPNSLYNSHLTFFKSSIIKQYIENIYY